MLETGSVTRGALFFFCRFLCQLLDRADVAMGQTPCRPACCADVKTTQNDVGEEHFPSRLGE